MASKRVRLGTRGSQLALFQARAVADRLAQQDGPTCEIVVIKTSGDRLAEAPLAQIGGKRLFVKEIEDALLAGDIDIAVHSSKDMPAVPADGLEVAGVLPREEPLDAVVLPGLVSSTLTLQTLRERLGRAPRIGTSSVRRISQLLQLFPNAAFLPVRGNLDTRLRKLDEGQFDALVLAAAGLKRLQQGARIAALLPVDACVPAPGQGIIAVETRGADSDTMKCVAGIDDEAAHAALDAERAVVTRLGGGCQMPIGAYATLSDRRLLVHAIVLSLDGKRAIRTSADGLADAAHEIGIRAADDLLARGAAEVLANVAASNAPVKGLQP